MLPDRPSRSPDREALTRAIADLLLASGAELDAETRGTPERVAKAWIEDLLDGYGKDAVDALKSSLVPAPKKGEPSHRGPPRGEVRRGAPLPANGFSPPGRAPAVTPARR